MASVKVAVYIGRFQPFHLGHAHILKQAFEENDIVIVLVGSAGQARTPKNPWTFEDRRKMIYWWAEDNLGKIDENHDLMVVALPDQPYNNAKWIQSVQDKVTGMVTKDATFTVYGSDRDSSTWYLKVFPQWGLRLLSAYPSGLSATGVRKILFEIADPAQYSDYVPATTMDFIEEWVQDVPFRVLRHEYNFIEKYKKAWEVAPYPPTFVTADAVVIQSGHILVVERGQYPGKGLWALPGGFVKATQTVRQAAIDELVEETGILLASPGPKAKDITKQILDRSILDEERFDAPDRSLRGRTITTAFLFRLDDTKSLPKVKGQNAPLEDTGGRVVVETRKAFWLPINDARAKTDRWFEDHHAIIDTMLGRLKD